MTRELSWELRAQSPRQPGSMVVVAFVALLMLSSAAGIAAQSIPTQHAKIDLIADQRTFDPEKPFWVGVLFQLDKGWHVYWQNPGDSGEPPRIEWKLPAGFRAGPIEWPRPVRLGSGSVIDYGYEDEVLLMAPVIPTARGYESSRATISAGVKYIVCREICVPGKASLSLAVPLATAQLANLAEWRQLFNHSRSRLPRPAPAAWKISAISRKERFVLSVKGTRDRHVFFFPVDPSIIENSAPQSVAQTDDGVEITLRSSDQLLKSVSVLNGLLAFEDGLAFRVAAPVATSLR